MTTPLVLCWGVGLDCGAEHGKFTHDTGLREAFLSSGQGHVGIPRELSFLWLLQPKGHHVDPDNAALTPSKRHHNP